MIGSEDLLRGIFRSQGALVDEGLDLLPEVRRRIGVRRRRTQRAAVAAVVAVIAIIATGGVLADSGRHVRQGPPRPAMRPAVPAGWRVESSLGAEIIVPSDWDISDWGCPVERGTVMRAVGFKDTMVQCVGPRVPAAQLSIASLDRITPQLKPLPGEAPSDPPAGHTTAVDGVPAVRGEGRGSDGRFIGWIKVPSHDLMLTVRTLQPDVGLRILGSLRLVDTDSNGCATKRSVLHLSAQGPAGTQAFVPGDATGISVCYYGERQPPGGQSRQGTEPRLQASADLTGQLAGRLAAAINTGLPGAKAQAHCAMPEQQGPDAVLLIRDRTGRLATVFTISNSCAGLGLDNGRRHMVIPRALARQIMSPLHTAYGPDPTLTN